jgi:Uma2 family endonuclease
MSTVESRTSYTSEDLLTLPEGDRYELIDGQLVERFRNTWASYVAGEILHLLLDACEADALGWVFPSGVTYQCFPTFPEWVRKVDVSFIGRDRLSFEEAKAPGHARLVPDLAVEVVSRNDVANELALKGQAFLEAGVRLFWVVHPETRTVEVHRRTGTGTILHENDDLSGEDVLPGFRCRVGTLFEPPPLATPGTPSTT